MERRLAAILAADVVGYTTLVQADEAETLRRMKAIWAEVFETNFTGHRGRIFKTMGDGALAEFASVVDAVECAWPRNWACATCSRAACARPATASGSRPN